MITTRVQSIAEPAVTLADAKAHLRVEHADEDGLITTLIAAATGLAEQHTGRSIARCAWRHQRDGFPADEIRIPWPPLLAVQSIEYIDAAGAQQTLSASAYRVDMHSEPARITLQDGHAWPATAARPDAVTVHYTAGYGAACPAPIRQWILLQVGHWYRHRESTGLAQHATPMPYVDGLLDHYRTWTV